MRQTKTTNEEHIIGKTAKLTAQEAINKIKSTTIVFLGVEVPHYNYGYQGRAELQRMAENHEIAPAEYYKALKMTTPPRDEKEAFCEESYIMAGKAEYLRLDFDQKNV